MTVLAIVAASKPYHRYSGHRGEGDYPAWLFVVIAIAFVLFCVLVVVLDKRKKARQAENPRPATVERA